MSQSITLSDYFGHIIREMVTARVNADRYTAQIAAMYEKDDLLKHFPIPRFKIREMDIDVPVQVLNTETETSVRVNIEKPLFANFIKDELNRLLKRYGSSLLVEAPEFAAIQANIQVLFDKIVLARSSESIDRILRVDYQAICFEALSTALKYSAGSKNQDFKLPDIDASLANIRQIVSGFTIIENPKLKNLQVNPLVLQSDAAQGGNHLFFKLRVNEESIVIDSLINDNKIPEKRISLQ